MENTATNWIVCDESKIVLNLNDMSSWKKASYRKLALDSENTHTK